jgi:hypothetical protein
MHGLATFNGIYRHVTLGSVPLTSHGKVLQKQETSLTILAWLLDY